MRDESFVEINSIELIAACERALSSINASRINKLEETISSLMNKRFSPCKTREAAIKKLQSTGDGWSSWYDDIMIIHRGRLESLCEDLIGMANLSSTVYLCRDDYCSIKEYFV